MQQLLLLGVENLLSCLFHQFLTLFNIWYSNHNLFQIVENIDNTAVILNGILIFEITLIPYFTLWLTQDAYSIASETSFGLLFIGINIACNLSVRAVHKSDPYNDKLIKADYDNLYALIPLTVILIGFVLTYSVFIPRNSYQLFNCSYNVDSYSQNT